MADTDIDLDADHDDASERGAGSKGSRTAGVGIGAAVAVAVVAGVVAWLVFIRDDGSSTTPASSLAASVDELRELLASVDHPVYWAGPSAGDTYELTRTANGSVYIRYLPEGTEPGSPQPKFTTVGTYPSATAYATLEAGARRKDAMAYRFGSGALAVTYAKTPSSVFFAFPGSPYVVEVFDPSPARALKLVSSGEIRPVE